MIGVMNYLKQLIFGVAYLLLLGWMVYECGQIVGNPWIIFDLGWGSLWEIIMFAILVGFSGLLFGLNVVMSKEKLIDIGVVIVGGMMPLAIIGILNGIILGVTILTGELLALMMIRGSLKSYLTFSASNILVPGVKNLTMVVLIGVSIIYGINLQKDVNKNGFRLPDGIVDSAIKLSGGDMQNNSTSVMESLGQNSELLTQFGITPEQLKSLDPSMVDKLPGGSKQVNQQTILKDAVNKQLSNAVAPFLAYVGIVMGGLFLISMLGIIGLIYPLLGMAVWGIFKIMENSGMIRFEKEMREVRKLVV